ncbi:ubiquinol-cytochrome C chaperone-domain-containing protein [Paraphysoderma sedebokerense]|nr:ubiquinol-cytochrome C chaperone-domain-containing protein [Paraphysoderma sedebokerense]
MQSSGVQTEQSLHRLPLAQSRLHSTRNLQSLRQFSSSLHKSFSSASSQSTASTRTTIDSNSNVEEIPEWKQNLALKVGKWLGYYRKEPKLIRHTLYLYQGCKDQTEKNVEWVLKNGELPDTFQTWFSLSLVHIWLLMVRLRAEGPVGKEYIQGVVDHFFRDMEDRLWAMGIKQQSIISRSLKEFLSMFYGGVLAFDEGLGSENDIVLGAAVWRNLFAMNSDMEEVSVVVEYMRRELQHLDQISAEDLLSGKVNFSGEIADVNGEGARAENRNK